MYLIEKISNSFAKKIANELEYDNDKQEVIAYGTFALLQIAFSVALVVIFGLIFGVVIEALILTFTISILRKYAGGVHASSPTICIVVGTVICIGFAALSKIALFSNFNIVLYITIITFILSYIILYKLAPIASKSKPLSDAKKVRMKKGSIITLSIYMFIVAILFVLYFVLNIINLLNYIFCINIGILWQVFTLTKVGDKVLGSLDSY